jgi:hypothetical protein
MIGTSKYITFPGKPEVFRVIECSSDCLLYQPDVDCKSYWFLADNIKIKMSEILIINTFILGSLPSIWSDCIKDFGVLHGL